MGGLIRKLGLGAVLAAPALGLGPAQAEDWTIPPLQFFPGNAQLDVGAAAGGALLSGTRGQGPGVAGSLKVMPRLHRDYDSGLSIGAAATLTLSDPLSRGRYGGDFFEKAYGEIRTGLGRLEVGQTDGAAFAMAVGGPKVSEQISLDDPQTTLFRDPSTDRAFTDVFALRTRIGASSNYAKFAYTSPNLFGAQLAISFTPNSAKQLLPFLHAGPQVPGRQAAIWEAGLSYSDEFGPVNLSAYAGLAEGRAERKLPGQEGVSDLGAGLRVDYPVNDDVTVSLGGAYRQSNAHTFDTTQSWQAGTTNASSFSASLTHGLWTFGLEAGNGAADKVSVLPRLGLHGYQAALGYALSPSLQLTGGWQRLQYDRSAGSFYNGAPRIGMNAGFLHFYLHT